MPESAEETKRWATPDARAVEEVLVKTPQLANPLRHMHKTLKTTSFRLYNSIAPVNDDSVVIVGLIFTQNYFRSGEVQAMWATAHLDKKVALPAVDEQEADLARFVSWARRQYLSIGEHGSQMPSRVMRYTDKLLHELGFSSYLRGTLGVFSYPSAKRDLAGLTDEYLEKVERLPRSMVSYFYFSSRYFKRH